jgi:leader peptidase (prepilin peptidase)/N-methyltransferase
MIILDEPMIIASIIILLMKLAFFGFNTFTRSIFSGLIMFIFMMLIKLIGDKVFKRESLGGGDIKLAILLGVALDLKLGLAAFVLSAFIAFPYALFVSIFKKEAIVPYGPFIIGALVIVFSFSSQATEIINKLFYL